MQSFRSRATREKRECAKVNHKSVNKSKSNAFVHGKNKSLAQLFQSLDSYAKQSSTSDESLSEERSAKKSLFECKEAFHNVEGANESNSYSLYYKYLAQLLHAMYLITFTEKAQLHRTGLIDSFTSTNSNACATKKTVMESSNTNDRCEENPVDELSELLNKKASSDDNSEHSNAVHSSNKVNSSANICAPTSLENHAMQTSSHGTNNIVCVESLPRVSNMISTRWREAVEQFCRHTVQLDDIARVAFVFPEWIDVKWEFSGAAPVLSSTGVHEVNKNDSNSHKSIESIKTLRLSNLVCSVQDAEYENKIKTINPQRVIQENNYEAGELTARVYYLQSHVPCLEELIEKESIYEERAKEFGCVKITEHMSSYDLHQITAYGCYLGQKKINKNFLAQQLIPTNRHHSQVNNVYLVNNVKGIQTKLTQMSKNNLMGEGATNLLESHDGCNENTFAGQNATCGLKVTHTSLLTQECKATRSISNDISETEQYNKCEVSDDVLLAQLSRELRSSLSERKLQELLHQMRRDMTRADDKEREQLERQQECERIIHSYEHICALFSRKRSYINARELISAMELENRFDDKRRAVQQLELLLQYPESGLCAFSIDVNTFWLNCTRKDMMMDNTEQIQEMKDDAKDASKSTLVHDVIKLTRLSPAQLQCVLITFNHTNACLQKLIRKVECHITYNLDNNSGVQ